jgi:hypothetical protein
MCPQIHSTAYNTAGRQACNGEEGKIRWPVRTALGGQQKSVLKSGSEVSNHCALKGQVT